MALKIFANILEYKETYNYIFNISGERCWLHARYLNGSVTC